MPSRMDRYNAETRSISSRTTKNQQLYKELSSNKTYTEFTDTVRDNIVDLSTTSNKNVDRRSNYNRTRSSYEDNFTPDPIKKDTIGKSIRELFDDVEVKSYNINDVMDNARKNREEIDEEEKKRRIKSAEYSILSDLSEEKLKEYRERKEKGISKAEAEELDELIHTITSKSLRKKIDAELFNDLLPDSEDEETVSGDLMSDLVDEKTYKKLEETKEQVENTADLENGLDKSFYTRSMDLKREDLILGNDEEEMDTEFDEKNHTVLKIIITIVITLIVIGAIGFVIYKYV